MGPLGTVANYALQIIRKMQNENIKSLAPRQDMTDLFNEHSQVSPPPLQPLNLRAPHESHDTDIFTNRSGSSTRFGRTTADPGTKTTTRDA